MQIKEFIKNDISKIIPSIESKIYDLNQYDLLLHTFVNSDRIITMTGTASTANFNLRDILDKINAKRMVKYN